MKQNTTINNIEEMYDNGNKVSTLELKFYKRLLQVRRNTPTLAVRGELGRYPITISAITSAIRYYYSIRTKPANKLVHDALEENIKLHKMGMSSWYGKLANLLKVLKLDSLLTEIPSKFAKTKGSKVLENRLRSRYESYWLYNISKETSNKRNVGKN
jgi:hypothetical protein